MATKHRATSSPQETAVQVRDNMIPEHLQKYSNMANVGLENLSKEDMVMPRLAVAQQMSPQVQKTDPLYIPGLEVGQFFNTVSGEIYGETVRLTPLFFFPSRIFFPPRGSDKPELCRANQLDENGRLFRGRITPQGCDLCPHSQWLDNPRPDGSTRPDCTYFMNYICVIHKNGIFEPIAFSLKSKMMKPAKNWNSKLRVRQLPAFCMVTDVTTVPEKAPKGTFFNVKFGDVQTAGAEVSKLEKLFETWSNREIKIDTRGSDVDEDVIEVDDNTM
jgi:hypothetical protein